MASREKKLAKNTIMLMIGKVCTQCVSFFMLPLYTAVLGTDEYGTADLIITYISLIIPLIGLQFEQGLFRMLLDYRGLKNDQKQIFSTVLLANFVQILIFTVVFFGIILFVDSEYMIYLLPLVILQLLQSTMLQFARGIGKTGIYTIASFLYAFINVVANVILVGIIRIGLVGLLLSMIIAGVASILYLCISLAAWRYIDFKAFNRRELKEIANYSIPLIPNQLAWWVINASDRTIVSFVLGTGANGIYSVANKFSSVYITFYNYFNMSWTESVSLSINDTDNDEYINKMINTFFNLLAALCIGIIACMPFVFSLLVNSTYKAAYYQIPILMIAVFFQALQGLYSAIYVALKKTKEIAKTSMISAIINIVVDLMLIKSIGLYAASVSTLIAFLSMAIYRYIDIRKYINLSLKLKNIILAAVICGISCVTYYMENYIVCGVWLVVVVVYDVLMNKEFLTSSVRMIMRKLRTVKHT